MNKQKFLSLIKDIAASPERELGELQEISLQYPYAQNIHIILAKITHDHQYAGGQKKLHKAALYTANRQRLKEIIENTFLFPKQETDETSDPNNTSSTDKGMEEPIEKPGDHLIIEKSPPDIEAEIIENIQKQHQNPIYDELDTNLQQYKKRKGILKGDKEETGKVSNYLENLKKNKKKIIIEDDKQKEQMRLINKFIKKGPRLSRMKTDQEDMPEQRDDLSIPKLLIGEDLVSENLALILKKQGKKEKAIDIYKKLIWQYPEKKAYFADRIEELKNS